MESWPETTNFMPDTTSRTAKKGAEPPPLSRASLRQRLARRDAWSRQIAPGSQFHRLFEHLPGVHFFAKNRRGELMFVSQSVCQLYGFPSSDALVGLTDFDLNPPGMAQGYVDGDAQIFRTGEPVLGRVELWWDARGLPDWYQVTKLPVRSQRGRVIGIMGMLRRCEGSPGLAMPWCEIAPVVRHLREHFREPVSLAELAKQNGFSPRQLERKFRAILGLSPQQFLLKTRVLAASHALRHSARGLAEIATDCGFYDQSSFTDLFRRHVGQTPREFRYAAAQRPSGTAAAD